MGCGSSKDESVKTTDNPPHQKQDDNIKNIVNEVTERPKSTNDGEVDTPEKPIHGLNCNVENDDHTTGRTNDGNQLVIYSESCKAFPRPPPPPVMEKTDQDQFFSPELKAIYPGFDAVARLDEHVQKTPTTLKQNIHSLVEYLMVIASTEYDKARVVIRWVATNIAYDVGFLTTNEHQGSSDAQDVLTQGSGVCEGFSNLVLEMCRICNLPCEKITGIAKGSGYSIGDDLVDGESSKKFRHAWNRIKIANTWFLCDATWASGYPEKVNGVYIYTFHWNEGYFMVPLETLRYSHRPDDNNDTRIAADTVDDVIEWTNQARIFPSGCLYKVSSVTPSLNEGCITTDSNKVELTFISTYKMMLRYTLIDESTEQHVENAIACITNGNKSTLLVRLPGVGVYSLVLFGEPVCLSERSKEVSKDMLMSFKIHTTCTRGSLPFPDFTYILGSLSGFVDGGFRSSVTSPIIQAIGGYAQFTIQKPGGEPLKFNFRDEHGTELDQYVFADNFPGKVVFNIRCPKKGEYSLILFARLTDDQVNKDEFKTCAAYIILNNNEQNTSLLPYLPIAQWGPNDKLAKLEISLDPKKGSEITCNREETDFELSFSEEQINILYSLKPTNNATENKWVYAETSRCGHLVRLKFRFRVPVTGFHEFNLFAGKVGAKTNEFIGRWLINVLNPYEGDTFDFNKNVPWGPNVANMLANELQVLSPNSSTIYPNDEASELVVASTRKRRTGVIFNFKNGSDTDLNDCVLADSLQQNDETILYRFKFHPPKPGFYCFDAFGTSGDCIGSWMVDARKADTLALPKYDKRPWGPVQKFFDSGFSVALPDSAIISTSIGAESTLTLTTGPRGKILGQLHYRNQKEEINDRFDIEYFTENEHGKKIVITFNLTKNGYYKFSLFISNTGKGSFDYGGGWLLHCA